MNAQVLAFLHRLTPEQIDAIYSFVLVMQDARDTTNAHVLAHIEGDAGVCAQCNEAILKHNR